MRCRCRRHARRAVIVGAVLVMGLASQVRAGVVTYPAPDGAARAADFRVRVDGQAQFVYDSEIAAFVSFSFSKSVHVAVTPQKAFSRVDIRPKHRNVAFTIENGTIQFDLDEPCQLSIELDGDIERPLFLFANPVEKKVPKPDDKRVRYFGPGRIHEAGEIVLESGQTLYIAGGAVVRGRVRAEGAKNVKVRGRGILDGSHRDYKTQMLKFSECTNVDLEGITILNSYGWTVVPVKSDNVKIDNVKIVGWRDNDGDWATVENIRFEDIRVEDSREKLIEFRIGLSIYSGDCPQEYHRQNPNRKRSPLGQWMPVPDDELETYAGKRGRIRNVHFKDIEVTGAEPPKSFLIGYDEGEHSVQNVIIENLRINGVHVDGADGGHMVIERAKSVRFK
ncbi:MAG: hypothetical protein JSW27_16770 [Phycisphaerales bacterium]|nr:MAG: hypothetical protein JSW27_16770 [Phycisphaerales bacterium]